jgi:hypothetical protein
MWQNILHLIKGPRFGYRLNTTAEVRASLLITSSSLAFARRNISNAIADLNYYNIHLSTTLMPEYMLASA